ncbi:MAG: RNA methyltransferase [Flavobacteriaceae bacterium]|nr:RNA methyltransferase [Flavobacteriaceae bacterium]
MLSKLQIKTVRSLRQKKYRQKSGFFIAEGQKIVFDLINKGFKVHWLFGTEEISGFPIHKISNSEMTKISNFKSPSKVLGVFYLPCSTEMKIQNIDIVLERIQDPGNMGTIIRLCDWFGFDQIICSNDSVDYFNPKVIQSSMGSFSNISCHYRNLSEYLSAEKRPIFGTATQGASLWEFSFPNSFILLFGNESLGIGKDFATLVKQNIRISKFQTDRPIDSLNIASALGIFLFKIRNQ